MGRAGDVDISLSETGLPQVALKLEKTDKGYTIENVEKHKKIKLNGCVLNKSDLSLGDRLEAGAEVFIADHAGERDSGQTQDTGQGEGPRQAATSFQNNLNLFAQAAAEEKDLNQLLQKILNIIMNLTKGTEAIIFTLTGEGQPEAVVSSGLKNPEAHFSDTIIQDVLNSGKGVAIPNTLEDTKYAAAQSIVDLKLQTVLCTPVMLAGKMTGLIYVGCRKGNVSYSPQDLESLNIYALTAGMLIHNVDYISQQRESIRRLAAVEAEGGIVAQSQAMKKVLDQVSPVAASDISILLQGETGTGKDVLAGYIHAKSGREPRALVAVNCSSLRGELLESELFGYKKGAFTGAAGDRQGLYQAAHQGTIFLDEIGEMDLNLQAKLLRVLESGKVRPVGGIEEESVDVRVLCATNKDLQALVDEGTFREDLFFRLAQMTVTLPPLKERGEDILLLAYHFLEKFKAKYPQKEIKDFHPDTIQALMTHEWPGNIRELVNVLHRSVLTCTAPILTLDVATFKQKFAGLEDATKQFQKNYISRALAMNKGNREETASSLGMSRSTFFRYLSQLGVE
ncbi:sigma 54-interacting transcriptional regulator [Fibrobacterota bacterium]